MAGCNAKDLFLFSDLFVGEVKRNNFKMESVSDMWTANCVDAVGEGSTDAVRVLVLGWPTVNAVATFSSPGRKDKWRSVLQRYTSLEKEDYPRSIPLKIFSKDIGNCAYSETIVIRNSDPANERINSSLPALGQLAPREITSDGSVLAKKRRHIHVVGMNVPMDLE